jgi:hypothetical protein
MSFFQIKLEAAKLSTLARERANFLDQRAQELV